MSTQEKTLQEPENQEKAFAGLTMFGEAPLGAVCGPDGCEIVTPQNQEKTVQDSSGSAA